MKFKKAITLDGYCIIMSVLKAIIQDITLILYV